MGENSDLDYLEQATKTNARMLIGCLSIIVISILLVIIPVIIALWKWALS